MKLLYQRFGNVTKICSARCYDAIPGSKCSCICGGKLHAMGEQKALKKLRQMLRDRNCFYGNEELKGIVTRRAQRAIRRMEEKDAEA